MATQAREEARHLPHGVERDALLMEAHRADTAVSLLQRDQRPRSAPLSNGTG
jgi:hypothetical protein